MKIVFTFYLRCMLSKAQAHLKRIMREGEGDKIYLWEELVPPLSIYFGLKQLSFMSHPSDFPAQHAHNFQAQNRLCLVFYLENNNLIIHTIRLLQHCFIYLLSNKQVNWSHPLPKSLHNNPRSPQHKGNKVKSTNNPRDGRTQISHSVCYFYNRKLENKTNTNWSSHRRRQNTPAQSFLKDQQDHSSFKRNILVRSDTDE